MTQKMKFDLAGQKHGNLTCLLPARTGQGVAGWLCRCDCGYEWTIKTSDIRRAVVTQCRSCSDRSKVADLAGLRFGRLTCIRRVKRNCSVMWLCMCDCGTKQLFRSDRLRRGDKKHCWKCSAKLSGTRPQKPGEQNRTVACRVCGRLFRSTPTAKFCSLACKAACGGRAETVQRRQVGSLEDQLLALSHCFRGILDDRHSC